MAHNGPRFEWKPRPWRNGQSLPVFYQLMVNHRPVGAAYWTKDVVGPPFYVGVVQGQMLEARYTTRAEVTEAVEEEYRNRRWG